MLITGTSTYKQVGSLVKFLAIPYVLSIILTLFWSFLGTATMIGYWVLVSMLARKLRLMSMRTGDTALRTSGTWFLVAGLIGFGTTTMSMLLPINFHLDEMTLVLEATVDPRIALQLLAPYIIEIMILAIATVPLQTIAPAAFNLLGWTRFKEHVTKLADVQKHLVFEGITKLIVAHKVQLVLGFLTCAVTGTIWGTFAAIALPGGDLDGGILALLAGSGILAIGVVVTALVSFVALLSGYSKTGNMLVLLETSTGAGVLGGDLRDAKESRCKACGNVFTVQQGMKFCPVCGVILG
jgi:hypothetical protein